MLMLQCVKQIFDLIQLKMFFLQKQLYFQSYCLIFSHKTSISLISCFLTLILTMYINKASFIDILLTIMFSHLIMKSLVSINYIIMHSILTMIPLMGHIISILIHIQFSKHIFASFW